VLGTERHEARRIDNQLRGRAGRQGDPGETQFFVSLDDDLMRVFGGSNIKGMMEKLGFPEDQPIENKIINRSLENAQKKIEGFNFDARKHTLEYDNVLNIQRTSIYSRRRKMLEADMNEVKGYVAELIGDNNEIKSTIENKIKEIGNDNFYEIVRRIVLYVTDILWTEHLETMEYTRSSVNLRAYGQREPLVEYKKEGLRLFKEMEINFKEQVFSLIKTINVDAGKPVEESKSVPKYIEIHESNTQAEQEQVKNIEKKIGRNDPCFCGSGKKYKKCHGNK
jgi:preprotein translocase subunit SecA